MSTITAKATIEYEYDTDGGVVSNVDEARNDLIDMLASGPSIGDFTIEVYESPVVRSNPALDALRRNVTGKVESGQAEPITEQRANRDWIVDGHLIAAPTADEAKEAAAALYSFIPVEVKPAEYGYTGWEAETDLGNDDDREGVHYLTILDPEGEEFAIIVHRVSERFPLDGENAAAKVRRAEAIVEALNATL